ncbi:MAG: transposase, partial [Crenarchaeota archaeon]|nr:transposase [Thermoproteota archaeon]
MAGPRLEKLKLEKRKRKISNKTFTHTLNLLNQHLILPTAPNIVYPHELINRCLLYLCTNQEYAEGGMNNLSEQTEQSNNNRPRITPTGRTLRNRLQTINAKDAQTFLTEANDQLLNDVKELKTGIFKRKVTSAIDFTRNDFYGDFEHTPKVRGGKYKNGTCYGYVYASIHMVEAGKRLTLYTLPADEFTEKVDVVEKLLEEAKNRGVHINYLLLDREFHTDLVAALLNALHIKYIMPAVKRVNVKEAICKYHRKEAPAIQKNFPLGNAKFTLVIYEKPKEQLRKAKGVVDRYFVFATNLSEAQAQRLYSFVPQEYKRRWGIETGFRVQDAAEPKTTSTIYAYRLLLHLCSVLVYNVWQYISSSECVL